MKNTSWSEIFNTEFKRYENGIKGAADAARNAGYSFFSWNGIIYRTDIILPTAYIVSSKGYIVISELKTKKSLEC